MKKVLKETKKGTWKYVWKLENEDWCTLGCGLYLLGLLLSLIGLFWN